MCPDCGRGRSLRVGDCQDTGNCIDFLRAQVAKLEAERAQLAQENAALKRVLFPDHAAREPGLTYIGEWRCGDTGAVRYAEHRTRTNWRVALANGGALTSQYGGVDVPADVFAWLIRPLLAAAVGTT